MWIKLRWNIFQALYTRRKLKIENRFIFLICNVQINTIIIITILMILNQRSLTIDSLRLWMKRIKTRTKQINEKNRKITVWKRDGPYAPAEGPRQSVPNCSRRLLSFSLGDDWLRCRRRPTPGVEVFVGSFSGTEHPPGMPAPSSPCLPCESKHLNPNLCYFGYLQSDLI